MKIKRTKIAEIFALTGAVALAVLSGWRDVGIDRANYVAMYHSIISSLDIQQKLLSAKDLTFLLLSTLANYFNEEPKLVFLFVCTLSIAAKYFAVKQIAPRCLLSFVLMYAVFLSPGLDFAAMRGSLAIGFLMLAVAYGHKLTTFVIFSFLTVSSHLPLLPAVLLAYRPLNKLLGRYIVGYVAIAVTTALIATSLITMLPRGADYEHNQGTIFAYSVPLVTFIITQFVFFRVENVIFTQRMDPVFQFLTLSKPIIYGLIAIAFGLSDTVVTASTRYLEITWCFLLLSALILYRKSFPNFIGLITLLGFLAYMNIKRFTWLAIIDPSFTWSR
jgi:hypothetical protein